MTRAYTVCRKCNSSWIWSDRIKHGSTCTGCGAAWPLPWSQAQQGRGAKARRRSRSKSQARQKWSQDDCTAWLSTQEVPGPPPGLPPKPKGKAREVTGSVVPEDVVRDLFAQADGPMTELLRKAGLSEPAAPAPDLASLCKAHIDSMPDAIKQALQNDVVEQTPAQVTGAAGRALNKATAVLKGKVMQKVALQDRLNKSKAAYATLLSDMSQLDTELKAHQEEVTRCQKELEARVAEAPVPEPLQDLHAALREAGLDATPEQVGLIVAKVRPQQDPAPPSDLDPVVQGLHTELAQAKSTIELLLAQIPQGQSVLMQPPIPMDGPMTEPTASGPPAKKNKTQNEKEGDRSRSPKSKQVEVEG